jgi:hypothetical protein
MQAGYEIHFEFRSRVKHYHEAEWFKYLRIQQKQGFWRVWLHMNYPRHTAGDSYSSVVDLCQPPLAMMSLAAVPVAFVPYGWWALPACVGMLGLAQLPLMLRLLARLKRPRYLLIGFMSFVRAYWRGIGMTQGMVAYFLRRRRAA